MTEDEMNASTALDALFRARWELSDGSPFENEDGCVDVSNLDGELDALATAVGFDRAAAVHRWVAEQYEEERAAHARYIAEGGDAGAVERMRTGQRLMTDSLGSLVRAIAEANKLDDPPKTSLVGMAVSALWKRAK